jgi:hypothetical protein
MAAVRSPILRVPGLAPHEVEAALCVLAVARALDVPLRRAFTLLGLSGVMLRMPDGTRRTFRRLAYSSVSRWVHACLIQQMSAAGEPRRRAA